VVVVAGVGSRCDCNKRGHRRRGGAGRGETASVGEPHGEGHGLPLTLPLACITAACGFASCVPRRFAPTPRLFMEDSPIGCVILIIARSAPAQEIASCRRRPGSAPSGCVASSCSWHVRLRLVRRDEGQEIRPARRRDGVRQQELLDAELHRQRRRADGQGAEEGRLRLRARC